MIRKLAKNIRLIRVRRSYSVTEIAALFKVHQQTVRTWHKAGMKPIEESEKPLLFLGRDIQQFLQKRRASKRRRLNNDQFYCARCKEARQSHRADVQIINTGRLLGRGKRSIQFRGKCSICSATVYRFGSFPSPVYDLFRAMITRAEEGLNSDSCPPLNAHNLVREE